MAIEIYINGIERTADKRSFKYKKDGKSRQSFKLALGGYTASEEGPRQFDKIVIYIDGSLFFDGFVDEVVSVDFNTGFEKIVYNTKLLPYENRFSYLYVNKIFNAPNQKLSDIIDALFTGYLEPEGVTKGIDTVNIVDDITIEYQEFTQDTTVIQALDELAKIGNYIWYIDKDKVFYFFRPSEYGVNVLTIDNDSCIRGVKLKNKIGKYRNKEIMYGGKARNNNFQIERVSGNDVDRQWNLTYQISQIQYVRIIDVNNPDPQPGDTNYFDVGNIGIFGLDDSNDNKVWLFNTHSSLLRLKDQLYDGTPLRIIRSDEIIEISYIGFIPTTIDLTDFAEVSDVQSRLGGTGVVEFVDKDETINDYNALVNTAQSWLDRESRFKLEADFILHSEDYPSVLDWEVGDLIVSNNNKVLPNATYTINELKYNLLEHTPNKTNFEVKINITDTTTADYDSWVDYWKQNAMDKKSKENPGENKFKFNTSNEIVYTNEDLSLTATVETTEELSLLEKLALQATVETTEVVNISEQVVVFKAGYTYPSLTNRDLGGVVGSVIFDNFSVNDNLYIYK